MADSLFNYGQLPVGAPSLDDDRAWAPAGGPQGAVPDAQPFTARFVDPDTLTAAQRHAMRQAISSGDRGAYERFLASLNPNSGTAVAEQPAPEGGAPGLAPAEAPPNPGTEPDASPERKAMAEALEHHGSSIEMVDALEGPIDAHLARLERMSEPEFKAHLEAGEAEVIQRVFRGNEPAYEQAVREIGAAAHRVGGDTLVQALAESAVLADPSLFERIMLLAKSVNSGKQS